MIAALLILLLWAIPAQAAETRDIIFPVIGDVSYSDDFGAPRSGHTHEGNDLLGSKLIPLVATVDGTVRYVAWPEPSYGYMISITDADGYQYNYLHINNDTPGSDDDLGGGNNAYAPGMSAGYPVVAGQLLGYMGDSGNAENTTPHLHFEIRTPDGTAFSPYNSLQAAERISSPAAAAEIPGELLPYGEFTGGAHLALGNVDTDSKLELVTGAGEGGGPNVRVFDADGDVLYGWFAYDQNFRGGVDIATGDINGDGVDEIITAAGKGGGPQIRIFNQRGKALGGFFSYDETFHGGVNVTAADLDNDGKAEIITGPVGEMEPLVRVFTADGKRLYEFLAYDKNFYGGVDVAGQAATDTKPGRIVTGAGTGGGPQVRIFSKSGYNVGGFFAYDQNFRGGVRVAVSNGTIITAPQDKGGSDIRQFSIKGAFRDSTTVFENWWTGGYDVAASTNEIAVASAKELRRTAIYRFDY